jgi:hypothetical protein
LDKKRDYLLKCLEQARQELSSGRILLLAARGAVGLNLLLVAVNLWRGWRATDFYYVFVLLVWTALLVVQSRIHARRRERVRKMEQFLDGV